MADPADLAARVQEQINAAAQPRTHFQKNWECADCGDANDQPEYKICTACRDARLEKRRAS